MSCSDGLATSKRRTRVRPPGRPAPPGSRRRAGAAAPGAAEVVDLTDPRQLLQALAAVLRLHPQGVRAVLLWMERSVPSSTLRPRKIMKMKSHIRSATLMSWC